MLTPTLEKLKTLRMPGFARALLEQQKSPDVLQLSFEERIGMLVDAETLNRENNRLKNLRSKANLKQSNASLEDFRYDEVRSVDKATLRQLGQCSWVSQNRNVLITGMTGTGKTFLACALGQCALRKGIPVVYKRASRLADELSLARADGSHRTMLNRLSKVPLLIIDDWGLTSVTDSDRRDMLEMMDDRYSQRSTLITSQLPLEKWHAAMGEPTVADAICDRLFHNAVKLCLKGPSMRKEEAQG